MDFPRIAAMLTCHNRRELTVGCVEQLHAQMAGQVRLDIIVHDAASTDGTAAAIRARYPDVTLLPGDADQFWNRGMHVAFAHAMANGPYDYYLWVNDDTFLDEDALDRLLAAHRDLAATRAEPLIVAGATRDPDSHAVTYGGMRRVADGSPLRFERVDPDPVQPVRVDTINGNLVLIPAAVVARIGNLDPAFFHGLGDFDYGLRANASGCSTWLAPGTLGTCRQNRWADTRGARLKELAGPTRLRFGEWYVFARRWGGKRWPALVAAPFVRHAREALSSTPKAGTKSAQ
jgi:GT2 family glycosyltransferase